MPRDIPKEPAQTKERRVTLEENWPLPAVVVAYHVISDGHPDTYPLHIASKVLSDGQSSRIYQKLVYEKQIAVSAFGGANLIENPNLFYAVAIVQPGREPQEAIELLTGELERLKNEPISERDLQRTKNQFARDYILGRESNQQKALQLSHAAVLHGDIATADGEFEIFQNIKAADVQRVARTYFTPENRTVLTLMPARGAAGQAAAGRGHLGHPVGDHGAGGSGPREGAGAAAVLVLEGRERSLDGGGTGAVHAQPDVADQPVGIVGRLGAVACIRLGRDCGGLHAHQREDAEGKDQDSEQGFDQEDAALAARAALRRGKIGRAHV